ncbi:purine-binding chemotaxis protein CheW [bacterium]|nr:MAG: purine-binding chemotaxis protein CheW [bacterium]
MTSNPATSPLPASSLTLEATAFRERQVVALRLGQEVYGIDIALVHTVLVPQPITAVPKTPRAIRGVMNLRGRILPVVDLRTRFDLPPLPPEEAKAGRIVIIDAEGITAGLIVDGVSEVLSLDANLIEPPSDLLASGDAELITGIGRIPNRDAEDGRPRGLILLLDVLKALAPARSLTSPEPAAVAA